MRNEPDRFPYPLFPHVRQQGSWEAFIDGNQRLFKDGSGAGLRLGADNHLPISL